MSKVEVVRCKDCKYYRPYPYRGGFVMYCGITKLKCESDDYCSRGKRKE